MIRLASVAAAGLLLLGAAPAPRPIEYRLGLEPQKNAAPVAVVEIRLAGDADGVTTLQLPDHFGTGEQSWRYLSDLKVKGATVSAPDPAHRVLRHKPGAALDIRYRVRTAYDADPDRSEGNPYRGPLLRPDWFALLGDFTFATFEGRNFETAAFQWGKVPKGWRVVSDLEHGRMGQRMTVADVTESITMGGPKVDVVERQVPGGALRLVRPTGATAIFPDKLADDIAAIVAAERGFWADQPTPYLVAMVPLVARSGRSLGGTGRGDGFVLYASPGVETGMRRTIAHEHTHTWIPNRVGRLPDKDEAADYWLSEGFTDFFATRTLLRGGLMTPAEAADRLGETLDAYEASPVKTAPAARIVADFWKDSAPQQLPYQRGALLALKWDEEIRLKTGGKADLNTVIKQMRDHYLKFPAGQGPDVVTGLVSAAWVTARMDLRPDIERYAVKGEFVPLPETMADGCLYLRTTRTPTFDAGFDVAASTAAGQLKGVRPRGPAWNSGLRNGTRLDAAKVKAGDTQVQVEITVRDARGRARKVAYWPYGDDVVETHDLLLKPGMNPAETAECGRKIGGL